jgi:large subunit ribosomal protein L13
MKTYAPRPRDIQRRWYVIDANDVVLGRLASEVAAILRGKHKPIYAPHADTGDNVIVVNARGIRLTGGKEAKKIAYRHSGFPGGITGVGYERLLAERPAFVVERAVKGMLPKTPLGRSMIRKLQVYDGAEHPHAAQKPQALTVGEVPRWDGLPAAPAQRPEPGKRPARKPSRAKRSARPAAPGSRAANQAKHAAKPSTATSSAKKSSAKKSSAKKTTAKRTAAKKASSLKPRIRRTKKEGEGD